MNALILNIEPSTCYSAFAMAKPENSENDDPAISDLRERIAKLETHVFWMKKTLEKIDKRTWWVLGSVVVFGVISIALSLL